MAEIILPAGTKVVFRGKDQHGNIKIDIPANVRKEVLQNGRNDAERRDVTVPSRE